MSIEATMSEMGQTLPSHSAPVRINVCFSRQVTNRGQVVNEAKGHEQTRFDASFVSRLTGVLQWAAGT